MLFLDRTASIPRSKLAVALVRGADRHVGRAVRPIASYLLGFLRDESGPTAVEYAAMLALILIACVNAVSSVGHVTSGTFSKVNSTLSS